MRRTRSRILPACIFLLLAFPPAATARAGTLVIANKSDHTVDLVDPGTGKSRATLPTGTGPHEVLASPDGKLAYVAATRADAVVVVRADTPDVVGLIRAGREPDGMAWAD